MPHKEEEEDASDVGEEIEDAEAPGADRRLVLAEAARRREAPARQEAVFAGRRRRGPRVRAKRRYRRPRRHHRSHSGHFCVLNNFG